MPTKRQKGGKMRIPFDKVAEAFNWFLTISKPREKDQKGKGFEDEVAMEFFIQQALDGGYITEAEEKKLRKRLKELGEESKVYLENITRVFLEMKGEERPVKEETTEETGSGKSKKRKTERVFDDQWIPSGVKFAVKLAKATPTEFETIIRSLGLRSLNPDQDITGLIMVVIMWVSGKIQDDDLKGKTLDVFAHIAEKTSQSAKDVASAVSRAANEVGTVAAVVKDDAAEALTDFNDSWEESQRERSFVSDPFALFAFVLRKLWSALCVFLR